MQILAQKLTELLSCHRAQRGAMGCGGCSHRGGGGREGEDCYPTAQPLPAKTSGSRDAERSATLPPTSKPLPTPNCLQTRCWAEQGTAGTKLS